LAKTNFQDSVAAKYLSSPAAMKRAAASEDEDASKRLKGDAT
jgi:hypothetical protein